MNVKLLNVKYSPNVGDGLLVECLEEHLRGVGGTLAASSIDLAGRTAYRASARHRQKMMWVLETSPTVLRPHLARAGLSVKLSLGLRDHYRRELAGADAVVVGGGNLLSDQDLNFPMKIVAALGEAARVKARVAFYGCGVAGNWSRQGKKMLCAALEANPPVAVAVRDEASMQAWNTLFSAAAKSKASVVRDPGILASSVYRFDAPKVAPVRRSVAIGIMSALAIRYHGFESLSEDQLAKWYLGLVDEMIEAGFDVCLFTNGSPEDQVFAEALWAKLKDRPALSRIRFAAVHVPVDLCRTIFNADAVVAFRMHALIAAYSYGRPFVALEWDTKVDAFLASVGLRDNVFNVAATSPRAVAETVVRLQERGVDRESLDQVLAGTRRGIRDLVATLQA